MPTVGTVTYLSSVGAPLVVTASEASSASCSSWKARRACQVLSQPMLDGRGFLLPFSASQAGEGVGAFCLWSAGCGETMLGVASCMLPCTSPSGHYVPHPSRLRQACGSAAVCTNIAE